MKLKDILTPFSAWKNLALEPVTVKDPLNERPGSPRYRGFHKNDLDKCIGCGACEMICENKAIDLVEVAGIEAKDGDSPVSVIEQTSWIDLPSSTEHEKFRANPRRPLRKAKYFFATDSELVP